jgi:hypothetical protein
VKIAIMRGMEAEESSLTHMIFCTESERTTKSFSDPVKSIFDNFTPLVEVFKAYKGLLSRVEPEVSIHR